MTAEPGIRLKSLWVIIALEVVALIAIWWIMDASSRQVRVMMSMVSGLVFMLAVLIWVLFLAGLRGKGRLWGLLCWLTLPLLAVAVFEIRDVSGDVVPLIDFRWAPHAEDTLGSLPATGNHVAEDVSLIPVFPRFLGPNGNGMVDGPLLADDWDASPPQEVWRRDIGAAWSSFAIVGDLAITQEQRGDEELVSCYRLDTGEPVWAAGIATRYETTLGGTGPRATPSVDGERVYATGANGHVLCLNVLSGDIVWQRHLIDDFGGNMPQWGYASSPLVHDDLVIIAPGNENGALLVALDKLSGTEVWRAGADKPGYGTPRVMDLAGTPQILTLNASSVTAVAPDSGTLLWQMEWASGAPNVADPVRLDDQRVLVSSGYGFGVKLFDVQTKGDTYTATVEYHTPRLKAKFANFIVYEGYVYGLDDGIMVCMNPEDGSRVWKRGRYGHGQILLVGDRILLQSEQGELCLIQPTPDKHVELARIEVLDGKAWNTMAIAGNRLLMRNHRQAVALDLPLRP